MIEGHEIGGTCVNRGCVPSKALLAASGRVRDFKNEQHLKVSQDKWSGDDEPSGPRAQCRAWSPGDLGGLMNWRPSLLQLLAWLGDLKGDHC